MAESEEELKSLLMKVKVESEQVGLPLPLSPFSPPDRDRRGDSPAWSGRGSRPSRRTSG